MRRVSPLLASLVVSSTLVGLGCPELSVPETLTIACDPQNDLCPDGQACSEQLRRCIAIERADTVPPQVTEAILEAPIGDRAGPGQTITIRLRFDEPLGLPPVLVLGPHRVPAEPAGDDEVFVFRTIIDADDAPRLGAAVEVIDRFDNAATQPLELIVEVDVVPPEFTASITSVVGPGTSLEASGRFTTPGVVQSAVVLDERDVVRAQLGLTTNGDDVTAAGILDDLIDANAVRVRFTVVDDVGNVAAVDTTAVAVDREGPTVLVQVLQSVLRAGGVVTAVVSGDDVDVIERVLLETDDVDAAGIQLLEVSAGRYEGAVPAVSDGAVVTVVATARDAAGNTGIGRSAPVAVDNTAPIITTFQLGDGRITLSDDVVAQLAVNADAVGVCFSGDVQSAPGCEAPVSPAASFVVTLAAGLGIKTVTLHAVDRAGNEATQTATVLRADTADLGVAVRAILPAGQGAVKPQDALGISGDLAPGATLATLRARPVGGGVDVDIPLSNLSITEGGFVGSWTVVDVVDGRTYALEASALQDGVLGASATSAPFLVDATAPGDPSLTVTRAGLDDPSATLTLGATSATRFCVDGDVDIDASARCPDGRQPLTASTVVPLAALGDGPRVISVSYFDDAGHDPVSASTSVLFVQDGVVDSHPVVGFPDGQTAIKPGEVLSVGGTAELDGVVVEGRFEGPANANADISGVTLVDGVLGGSVPVTSLGEGTYTLVLIVERAGVRSSVNASRSQSFLVDPRAPTIRVDLGSADVVGQRAIEAALLTLSDDVVAIEVDGDVEPSPTIFLRDVDLPNGFPATLPLQLSGGDGTKALTFTARDGAANLGLAFDALFLAEGEPSASPIISNTARPGVNAVRTGDALSLRGAAPNVSRLRSARLVLTDVDGGPCAEVDLLDPAPQVFLANEQLFGAGIVVPPSPAGTTCAQDGEGQLTVTLEVASAADAAFVVSAPLLAIDDNAPVVRLTSTPALDAVVADPQPIRQRTQRLTVTVDDVRSTRLQASGDTSRIVLVTDGAATCAVDDDCGGDLCADGTCGRDLRAAPIAFSGDAEIVTVLDDGEGPRELRLQVDDDVGNTTLSTNRFTLDQTAPFAPLAPQLTLTEDLVPGTALTPGLPSSDSIVVSAGLSTSVEANARVFFFFDDSEPLGPPDDVAGADANGRFSLAWPVRGDDFPTRAVLVAVDAAGNRSSGVTVVRPVLTLTAPSPITTSAKTLIVDSSADVPAGTTLRLFQQRDGDSVVDILAEVPDATCVAQSARRFNCSVIARNDLPEAPGAAILRIVADGPGYLATRATAVTAAIPPKVFAVAANVSEVAAGSSVLMTAEVRADVSGIASATMVLSPSGRTATATPVPAPAPDSSLVFSFVAGGSEGLQTASLTVVDEAGNAATTTHPNLVRFDLSPPTIVVENPAGVRTNAAALRVRVSDSQTAPIEASVRIVDASNVEVFAETRATGAGTVTFAAAPLVSGDSYTAEFTSTDRVGNTATVTRAFIFDNTRPVISLSVTGGTSFDSVRPIEVSLSRNGNENEALAAEFRCSINSGVGTVSCNEAGFQLDTSGDVRTGTVRLGYGGSVTSSDLFKHQMAPRTHRLTVQAVDVAGNVSDAVTADITIQRRILVRQTDTNTCVVTASPAEARCWGDNTDGVLDPAGPSILTTPVTINSPNGIPIVDAQMAFGTLCVVVASGNTGGTVFCRGRNEQGQIQSHINAFDIREDPSSRLIAAFQQVDVGGSQLVVQHGRICGQSTELKCRGRLVGEVPPDNDNGVEFFSLTSGSTTPIMSAAAVGDRHACVMSFASGTTKRTQCFGHNDRNQLAGGAFPAEVGVSGTDVVAGRFFSCAVDRPNLRCFGDRTLLDGLTPSTASVLDVGIPVLGASAAGDHLCALATDGTLRCLGTDLGAPSQVVGGTIDHTVVVPFNPLPGETFDEVFVGPLSTCAVVTGTTNLRCFGEHSDGRLQTNITATAPTVNIPVSSGSPGGFGVVSMAGGPEQLCLGAGLFAGSNETFCAGRSRAGEFSFQSTDSLSSFDDRDQVFGVDMACAFDRDFRFRCRGLGDRPLGGVTAGLGPTNVTLVDTFPEAYAVGSEGACFATASNGVRCFGALPGGGTSVTPTAVGSFPQVFSGGFGGDFVAGLAQGDRHVCRMTRFEVRCFGANERSQLGRVGAPGTTAVPVTFGGDFLQAASPEAPNQIAAAGDTTCMIHRRSSFGGGFSLPEVACWGDNRDSQISGVLDTFSASRYAPDPDCNSGFGSCPTDATFWGGMEVNTSFPPTSEPVAIDVAEGRVCAAFLGDESDIVCTGRPLQGMERIEVSTRDGPTLENSRTFRLPAALRGGVDTNGDGTEWVGVAIVGDTVCGARRHLTGFSFDGDVDVVCLGGHRGGASGVGSIYATEIVSLEQP